MTLKEKLLSIKLVVDCDYLDKYCTLIESNAHTQKIKYKTQTHHIIPKYYYKFMGLEVDETANNLVNLLHKDHVLAHYYLALCSSTNEFKIKNLYSIRHVLNQGNYKIQECYVDDRNFIELLDDYQDLMEELNVVIGNKHRGKIESEETRKKKSISHKGKKYKPMSDEGRKNISVAHKGAGHSQSETTRKKISNKRKNLNLVNIRKGDIKKSVPKSNLEIYLKDGYVLGWGPSKNLNSIWIKKDNKSKQINKNDLNKYLDKGWQLGKYLSDEGRAKAAEASRQMGLTCMWITNEVINKRIKRDSEIPEGFRLGKKKYRTKKE